MVLVALDPREELLEHPTGGPIVPLPRLWEALDLEKFWWWPLLGGP